MIIAIRLLLAAMLLTVAGLTAVAQTREPASPRPAASGDKKPTNYLSITTVADAPPVIVETSPRSGADDVDPNLTELKITFSKDMQDGSWAWAQVSKDSFPETTGRPRYLDDKRTNVLPVKLQPNHTYIIWLNKPPYDSFQDRQHRKAIPYLLVFQTKSE